MREIREYFQNKSVAFVGGAPHLAGSGMGKEIDSFDIVWRSNLFPHCNPKDTGSRCDILTCIKDFASTAPKDALVITYRPHLRSDYLINTFQRLSISNYCRDIFDEEINQPTTGMISWYFATILGRCSSFKFFGITGYQKVRTHYTEEWMQKVGGREFYDAADYENHPNHNFDAQARVFKKLYERGYLDIDELSKKYFDLD